ncbi:Putative immunoglobulin-like, galactose oxidase-like, Early set domain-containing protein [Septoria linicola]|uniref:Immunoglobulin-like, galactose oxidase-like, Early set domain-containing protein n=1 Tax=Septoria linicola TaxID=215465 RepID=A0A9Q9AMC9_9PEZI|nr:putative immunoglobulin-like, galactose oxidase-like, Early set domain-containing protein [Septoria linicola]USW49598.1 Putative immunoglobulin-like, galactose oxidase-like, Early set domain-containing protein [Septoria linicola]
MSSTASTTFALLRIGSVTHSINSDQRRVPVTATRSGTRWTIRLPNDSGILIPGSYYLFALNGNGTPSIARTIRIKL